MKRRPNFRRGRESGSVTLWVVIMTVAMFAGMGLVSDGGQAMVTKGTAISDAYQAARAGAQALNTSSVRTGQTNPAIDINAARRAAATFLTAAGHYQIDVTTNQVTVTVHLTSPARILSAIGVHDFHVTGYGSAPPPARHHTSRRIIP
jgi:hypothetical protein